MEYSEWRVDSGRIRADEYIVGFTVSVKHTVDDLFFTVKIIHV